MLLHFLCKFKSCTNLGYLAYKLAATIICAGYTIWLHQCSSTVIHPPCMTNGGYNGMNHCRLLFHIIIIFVNPYPPRIMSVTEQMVKIFRVNAGISGIARGKEGMFPGRHFRGALKSTWYKKRVREIDQPFGTSWYEKYSGPREVCPSS